MSLLYDFVRFFGLDSARNTIVYFSIFPTMEENFRENAVGFVLEPKLRFSFLPEFEYILPNSYNLRSPRGVRTLENCNPNTSFVSLFFFFYKFSHCCEHESSLKAFGKLSSQPPSCQLECCQLKSMGCDFPGGDKFSRFGRSFFFLPK